MKTGLKAWVKGIVLGSFLALGWVAPAPAQIFLHDPVYPSGTVEASDALVGISLPGATPAEYRAHLLWNLRSGLNVAALQCQFSPFLRTVESYNSLIDHHSQELNSAYQALEGYFRRVHGRTGPRRFDDYSTQTYNNFSSLQAQLGFCQTAARIGKEALTVRKGDLHLLATSRMRELRGSLVPIQEAFAFLTMPLHLSPVNLVPDCTRLSGRERRTCERDLRRR